METIRELFHEIGNWHNKISVGAGVTKEILKQKSKDNSLPQGLKDMLIKRFGELERQVMGAEKVLLQLKDIIYGSLDPDTGKPKTKG
jgi:hypothetical protein